MHYALPGVVQVEQRQAGLPGTGAHGDDKLTATRHAGMICAVRVGIDNMVHHAEYMFGAEDLPTGIPQTGQRDGAGALVQEYPVYIDQVFTIRQGFHQMLPPEFVKQGGRHCSS